MQKTTQKRSFYKFKRTVLATILGTTILTGGLIQTAEAATPLWLANYLQGKTTSVSQTNNSSQDQSQSTVEEDTTTTTNTTNTNTDVSTGGESTNSVNDYWRNRYQTYTPSYSQPSGTSTGSSSWTQQPTTEQNTSTTTTTGESLTGVAQEEKILLDLLNQERQKRGLNPLKANSELTRLARIKAKDMADNNYFSHTSPNYGKAVDMVRDAGIDHWIVGENIAITSSGARANDLFMGSTTHRSTMLNSRYNEVGVGMYRKSNGTLYVAEIFIGTR